MEVKLQAFLLSTAANERSAPSREVPVPVSWSTEDKRKLYGCGILLNLSHKVDAGVQVKLHAFLLSTAANERSAPSREVPVPVSWRTEDKRKLYGCGITLNLSHKVDAGAQVRLHAFSTQAQRT